MIMSGAYDMLQEAGSKVMTLTQGQPWIHGSLEYMRSHPWISLGVATGVVITWKVINQPRNLPPGPFNLPIYGSSIILSPDLDQQILDMRPLYGDVIYLKSLGRKMVFLNSKKAIDEAFVKRGEEFSHRRYSPFQIAVGFAKEEFFSPPYNAEWKANKKSIVKAEKSVGIGTVKSEGGFHSSLEKFGALIRESKGKPVPLDEYMLKYSASLVFAVMLKQDRALDDPLLARMIYLSNQFLEGFVAGGLYDFLPDCQFVRTWLNGKAVEQAGYAVNTSIDMIQEMFNEHRATLDPTDIRNLIDYFLVHRSDVDDRSNAFNVNQMIVDAIATINCHLAWMFFYLTKYPDVQRKLQEQIDKVVGQNRKPSLSDKSQLPYAEAIILETLRCSDILSISLPRELKQNTQFRGYTIPKDVMVIANFHAVHHDPVTFPDPTKFDPSRFLGPDGKIIPAMTGHVMGFSVGPRTCIGEQHGRLHSFFTLVYLAQNFNMKFDPSQPEPPCEADPEGIYLKSPVPHKICLTER